MLRTKLFISSLSEQLKSDNMQIENFIYRISRCYLNKDLFFDVTFSADLSDAESIKREIAESSIAVFLLDTETGGAIRDTYKTARDSYNTTGKPKIIVYVKSAHDNTRVNTHGIAQDVAMILSDKLGSDAEFCCNTYAHADTLKLGILMQIKQLELPGVDIRLDDGKAWQGGNVLLPLDNVESVAGFESLQSLKLSHAELENRFYAAKTKYAENPGDTEAHNELIEASKKRGEALQEIQSVESQLYHMIEGMYVQTAKGKLSKRQEEGYRLIERGMLSEARDVLDFYSIVSESRHDAEIAEQAAQRAQIHIQELMQLKNVNAALKDWEGVDECFKEALQLEERHNLPRRVAVNYGAVDDEYIAFLIMHNRYNEAIEIGEKLLAFYKESQTDASGELEPILLNYLGLAYEGTNRLEQAEEAYRSVLTIRLALTDGDASANRKHIAIVYSNLSNAYFYQGRIPEAVGALESSMEIFRELACSAPERFEMYLGSIYINLSGVYNESNRYEEAADLAAAARDNFTKQVADTPTEYNYDMLSISYHQLGDALCKSKLFSAAEDAFSSALEIQTEHAAGNPDMFEPRIAECLCDFGWLYHDAKRYAEAEEKLAGSLEYFKKLAVRNPDWYELRLAVCYNRVGELQKDMNRMDEAEKALNSAIRIYEKYNEQNPYYKEKATEAKKLLDSVRKTQSFQGGDFAQLTPEEKEIALLLIEGETKRDISRKLHISTEEVGRSVEAIREKVVGMAGLDPVVEAVARDYKLTRREADMLRYLRDGADNIQIASALFLSEETVRSHVRSLLRKLSVEDRLEVAEWFTGYISAGATRLKL